MTTSNGAVRVNKAAEKPAKPKTKRKKKPRRRKALARLRKMLGWTQANLAAHIGVAQYTVCRWETGRTTPEPSARDDYAAGLKITVFELEALIERRVKLGELNALAKKIERRSFDESGALILEGSHPQVVRSDDEDETVTKSDRMSAVVMLYPAVDNQPLAMASNDAPTAETRPVKKRPNLRLIDCTQFRDHADDEEQTAVVNEPVVTSDKEATEALSSAKAISFPRSINKDDVPLRKKAQPASEDALGQLPLFKGLLESTDGDHGPASKRAVGG
ncbi:MAG: helix-turn-helix transcriptional regulator [Myxococcota bacterium]